MPCDSKLSNVRGESTSNIKDNSDDVIGKGKEILGDIKIGQVNQKIGKDKQGGKDSARGISMRGWGRSVSIRGRDRSVPIRGRGITGGKGS